MMLLSFRVCVILCLLALAESTRDPTKDQSEDPKLEVLWSAESDHTFNAHQSIWATNNEMEGFAKSITQPANPTGSAMLGSLMLGGSHIIDNRLSSDLGCVPWNELPALKCGDEVGVGAQGSVTLATYDVNCLDKDSNEVRNVAVKTSKIPLSNPFLRTAALNEIAVMELFNDTNLVTRIWDSTEDLDKVYILEEGIMGGTLENFITQGHSDIDKALVFHDIAFGLQEMHAKNVVHRDLKPANLLVTDDEKKRVKIADVSFACIPERATQIKGIMKCEGFFGTPAYLAPEIYEQQENNMRAFRTPETVQFRSDAYSTAIDMWSLGLILYQLILGVEVNDLWNNTQGKQMSQIVREVDIVAKLAEGTALARKLKDMADAAPRAAEMVTLLLKGLLHGPSGRFTATDAAVLTRHWLTALNAEEAYTQTLTDPLSGIPPGCFKRLQKS